MTDNPAAKILAAYNTADIIQVLTKDVPVELVQVKENVREYRDYYQEAETLRALAEADIMTDIAAETDPATGKAIYTNEKTRAAELLSRKAKNADYRDAERSARETRRDWEEAQDELDALVTKNRNYLAVAGLISAELGLLAAYKGLEASEVFRQAKETEAQEGREELY